MHNSTCQTAALRLKEALGDGFGDAIAAPIDERNRFITRDSSYRAPNPTTGLATCLLRKPLEHVHRVHAHFRHGIPAFEDEHRGQAGSGQISAASPDRIAARFNGEPTAPNCGTY